MKGIKSDKSVRKQMNKFLTRIEKDQSYTLKILKEQTETKTIKQYCEENQLNYHRVSDVLTYFKIDSIETNIEVPILLLNFIKDIGITTDEKINAVLMDIKKNNPELTEYNMLEYTNSLTLWTNYLYRDEKRALRMVRVRASINKKFYNYLVKRKYLIDVRNPENWHPQIWEEYNKKLESRKRGTDE